MPRSRVRVPLSPPFPLGLQNPRHAQAGARKYSCGPQGKRGDFIVLDRDIFAIDPFDLHDTRVMATYLDGREVCAAKAK
jgi:hypothetical protein